MGKERGAGLLNVAGGGCLFGDGMGALLSCLRGPNRGPE